MRPRIKESVVATQRSSYYCCIIVLHGVFGIHANFSRGGGSGSSVVGGITGDFDFRLLPSTVGILGFTQEWLYRTGIVFFLVALFLVALVVGHTPLKTTHRRSHNAGGVGVGAGILCFLWDRYNSSIKS